MSETKLKAGLDLGPFTLERRIALGGMAEIWSATREGRRLGLKVLQPFFARDEGFRAMFQDEVRIALRLRHEHILEVFDAHEHLGFSFQSMELLEGMDIRRILQRLVKTGRWFPVPLALYVGRAIARALAYAHARKNEAGRPLEIVHRDVSPHNVMITRSGGVKVLDFGIARAAERVTRTKTGVVKGKISYMAPEQAMAARVTPMTDIFATGIVLWEMLSLKRLFAASSDAETLRRVVRADVPPLREANDSVPAKAAELIHKMLSSSPEDRPESMQDVDNGLSRVLAIHYEQEDANQAALASWFQQFLEAESKTPVQRAGTARMPQKAESTEITEVQDTKSVDTKPGDLTD